MHSPPGVDGTRRKSEFSALGGLGVAHGHEGHRSRDIGRVHTLDHKPDGLSATA